MPHPTPKYNERNSDEVGSQARETTNFWQHQPMKARPWRPTTASQDACAGAPNQSAEKEGREPRAGRRTTIHFSNAARWWWSWPSRVEARTRVMPALSCLACCRYESVEAPWIPSPLPVSRVGTPAGMACPLAPRPPTNCHQHVHSLRRASLPMRRLANTQLRRSRCTGLALYRIGGARDGPSPGRAHNSESL